nr:RuvB-like protein 1 [Cryptomonas curvata]
MFTFDHTWHSHINKLSFNSFYKTNSLGESSVIGQEKAKNCIRIIVNMIKQNKMAGKVVIVTGISGSGKTALGLALGKELGESIPFTFVNGSEFSYLNSKKIGQLFQSCRKAVGIRIVDNIEFYEGEVTNIEIDQQKKENFKSIFNYIKNIEGSLRIKLKDSLYQGFKEDNVKIGDIIYIEPSKSLIKIIGKSSQSYLEQNLNHYDYVTLPTGKVFKKKTVVQDLTLNDLDVVNIQNIEKFYSKSFDVSDYLRHEVDKLVFKFIKLKKAEILYGVIFIDEAHNLDFSSFFFLTRLLDSKFSPLILLSTNRTTLVNFRNFLDPNTPFNFINRCLVIRTKIYTRNEIANILAVKAKNFNLLISSNSFKILKKISILTSLRFSILLTLASALISNAFKKKNLNSSIINFVNCLFFFSRESRIISLFEKNYLVINRIA